MNKEIIELILKDENLSTDQKTEIIKEMAKASSYNYPWYIPWYETNPCPQTPYWGGDVVIASQSPVPDFTTATPEWADKLKTVMTTASYDPDDFKGDVSPLVEWYKNVVDSMDNNDKKE